MGCNTISDDFSAVATEATTRPAMATRTVLGLVSSFKPAKLDETRNFDPSETEANDLGLLGFEILGKATAL